MDGSLASYRFYAGAPSLSPYSVRFCLVSRMSLTRSLQVTSSNGLNLGSLFIFDDKPRNDLSLPQKKCGFNYQRLCAITDGGIVLHQQAHKVMRHLETKRGRHSRLKNAFRTQELKVLRVDISRFLSLLFSPKILAELYGLAASLFFTYFFF